MSTETTDRAHAGRTGGVPAMVGALLGTRAVWTDAQWAEHDARLAAERQAETARERERDRQRRRRQLAEWGVPGKDIERALGEGLAQSPAVLRVQGWPRYRSLLVLSGPPGCGKTTAAAAWLASGPDPASWLRLADPLFVHACQLARYPRYDNAAMARLERARRLVVDDLGVEYADAKGAFASLLDELINARYAHRLPMVITTNLRVDAFTARYGERVTDRIRESGLFASMRPEGFRQGGQLQ